MKDIEIERIRPQALQKRGLEGKKPLINWREKKPRFVPRHRKNVNKMSKKGKKRKNENIGFDAISTRSLRILNAFAPKYRIRRDLNEIGSIPQYLANFKSTGPIKLSTLQVFGHLFRSRGY